MAEDPLKQQKEVEFYAASVTGWLNTSLEYDKAIFALSAGGLGLLISLVTTVGIANVTLLVLYVVAIVAFLGSLVTLLAVLQRNRAHVEQVVQGNIARDPVLGLLDVVAVTFFGAGALVTAVIGISTAVISYTSKERGMATESKQVQSGSTEQRSFNGLGGLKPQSTETPGPAPAPATPAPQQTTQPTSGASK